MNKPILTLPDLDDEAILKLHDFLYELLEAFETRYSLQIQKYKRDLRIQLLQNELETLFKDDDELSF